MEFEETGDVTFNIQLEADPTPSALAVHTDGPTGGVPTSSTTRVKGGSSPGATLLVPSTPPGFEAGRFGGTGNSFAEDQPLQLSSKEKELSRADIWTAARELEDAQQERARSPGHRRSTSPSPPRSTTAAERASQGRREDKRSGSGSGSDRDVVQRQCLSQSPSAIAMIVEDDDSNENDGSNDYDEEEEEEDEEDSMPSFQSIYSDEELLNVIPVGEKLATEAMGLLSERLTGGVPLGEQLDVRDY